ncbi:hypothetical protein B7P43_G06655, partial [Cryptotermes secundus]
ICKRGLENVAQHRYLRKTITNQNVSEIPTFLSSRIRKESSPPTAGPRARRNKDKSELFAKRFANIFTPHNEVRDQEIEQNLAAPIELQQTLTITTPKETKEVIKSLGLKKHPA